MRPTGPHGPTSSEILQQPANVPPARLAGPNLPAGLGLGDLVVIGITAAIGFTASRLSRAAGLADQMGPCSALARCLALSPPPAC